MGLLEPQLAAFPGGVRLVKVFYAVGIHKVPMSDGAPPHPIPLGVLVGASEPGQAGRPDLGFFLPPQPLDLYDTGRLLPGQALTSHLDSRWAGSLCSNASFWHIWISSSLSGID